MKQLCFFFSAKNPAVGFHGFQSWNLSSPLLFLVESRMLNENTDPMVATCDAQACPSPLASSSWANMRETPRRNSNIVVKISSLVRHLPNPIIQVLGFSRAPKSMNPFAMMLLMLYILKLLNKVTSAAYIVSLIILGCIPVSEWNNMGPIQAKPLPTYKMAENKIGHNVKKTPT